MLQAAVGHVDVIPMTGGLPELDLESLDLPPDEIERLLVQLQDSEQEQQRQPEPTTLSTILWSVQQPRQQQPKQQQQEQEQDQAAQYRESMHNRELFEQIRIALLGSGNAFAGSQEPESRSVRAEGNDDVWAGFRPNSLSPASAVREGRSVYPGDSSPTPGAPACTPVPRQGGGVPHPSMLVHHQDSQHQSSGGYAASPPFRSPPNTSQKRGSSAGSETDGSVTAAVRMRVKVENRERKKKWRELNQDRSK